MQNILKNWKITTWSISNRFEVELTITNDWTSRIVLHWSTSVLLETSYILFYQIYWYYLKMERNLFQFLSIIFSSWFWEFKTSRPAAKKKVRTTVFFWYFRGAGSRGTSPLDSPNSAMCQPDHLDKKPSIWTKKIFLSEQKQKQKRTRFLNLLGRLKYWLINSLW